MSIKVYSDQYRLILENTETRKQTVLDERRIGFIWPGVKHPGYILIMGLLNETTLKEGDKVVLLLKEIEEKEKQRFNELLVIWSRRYRCKYIITNFDRKTELQQNAFLKFKKKRGVKDIYLLDSKDFSGFEETAPLINELATAGNLRIPKNTVLNEQLSKLTVEDLKVDIEEKCYAVTALNHIISSWEYYPFMKPKKKSENSIVNEGYR